MTAPRAGTHGARLLAALEDGRWHTTRRLYRTAGPMILHSRVSELRKRGYRIEHEHIPGRIGAQAHRYRWLDAPLTETTEPTFTLTTDEIAPRIPSERYRLFRVKNGGPPEIVCAVDSREAVGVALCTLGDEGEWDDYCVGVQDSMDRWEGDQDNVGREGYGKYVGRWLVKPWQAGI